MVARGWRVITAAGEPDEEAIAWLAERGIAFEALPLQRAGVSLLAELRVLIVLLGLMRRRRPDVVFGYTVKMAAYSLRAARWARIRRRVGMITGVGYAFLPGSGGGLRRRLARLTAYLLLRMPLRHAHSLIFQNSDDRDLFVELGLVRSEQAVVVAGSGVDMDHFSPVPLPPAPPSFLMIARLLPDKGVREYIGAARQVRADRPDVRFVLVGPRDPNPSAIKAAELAGWQAEGAIEYAGELADVRPAIAAAHVYVLPSYREGLPRSVLEAMAMGRAIITTDVPGCRETVIDGDNGLLVPPRDTGSLAEACLRMIAEPDFVRRAGERSLELCRERFEATAVARQTMDIIAP